MKMLKCCLPVFLMGLMLFCSGDALAAGGAQDRQGQVSVTAVAEAVPLSKSGDKKATPAPKPPKAVSEDKPVEYK